MVSHPNRSGRREGRNPTAAEVARLRAAMGLTQRAFGELVYRSERIVQDWEGGLRRCPPDTFEYLALIHGYPAVREAREHYRRR